MTRTRAGRVVLIAIALISFGALLSACTSAKDVLGTTASPCFRAIAVAEDAVPAHAHFAGVRNLSATEFSADLLHDEHSGLPSSLASLKAEVCVVAYTGRFSTSEVKKGWSPILGEGHVAVVVVSAKQNRVIATLVLPRPPLRLVPVLR